MAARASLLAALALLLASLVSARLGRADEQPAAEALAGSALAARVPTGPTGYEHAAHAAANAAAGGAEIPCQRCHSLGRQGQVAAVGHAACFGACHGAAPRRWPQTWASAAEAERRPLCLSCHSAALFAPAGPGAPPPSRRYAAPRTARATPAFALRMSHLGHVSATGGSGGCTACHAPMSRVDRGARGRAGARAGAARAGAAAARAHARCVRCHAPDADAAAAGAAGPQPLSACTSCHQPAGEGPARPSLIASAAPAEFSHARHSARGLSACGDCHEAVAEAADNALPTPSTAACATCHDGERAFSVLTPSCTRCHSARLSRSGPRPPRGPGFSHVMHRARGLDLPCRRCHSLDAAGVPQPPASDHGPCSDAGCHRREFSSAEPIICGACHVGTDPSRPLYFTPGARADTEFGARYSHRAHPGASDQACAGCHRQRTALRQRGLPRTHATCSGAGCHELPATEGEGEGEGDDAEPDAATAPLPLTACEGCHRIGRAAARRAVRLGAPWSVRARFDHERHERPPFTAAARACTSCHQDVAAADSVEAIASPPKQSCAPCHDGGAAFKLTGHECVRCHGRGP
ncbi:cytochrome c3 family protein [Haliangium ochraceum]|uniref:Cytochrome c7-like domain-containing protein n=1 Tax=Haliangium ochraceum (strain DSM 14365 / JCM 11303 / SMP-2) TaxID=502025 RepID=D0LN72_HALO1|nr:cytochrome c3 family protein [Haliangium ochraceum]ACY15249.1 hypothetical protein Hoch_2720 [Haliangium ochraceum DSM 14365]